MISQNHVRKYSIKGTHHRYGSSTCLFTKYLCILGKIGFKNFHHFFKDPSGRFVVLYSYNAQDENDLSVERGQCVTVLNSDDPDWYWVSKFDGQEGFVPSGFIYPLDAIQRQREFPVYVTVSSKYLYLRVLLYVRSVHTAWI